MCNALRLLVLLGSSLLLSLAAPQNGGQFFNSFAYQKPQTASAANSVTPFGKQPIKNPPKEPIKQYVENFNHRYPDGSYEFRYELVDGTARYERGYYMLFDKVKTLVVVGYYAYRNPRGDYITVFYNADHNGYRQNQSITPQVYPNLPRSIDVPEFKDQQQQQQQATPTSYPKNNDKSGAYRRP